MVEGTDSTADWSALLRAIVAFQSSHGAVPLVGGTAAAIHAGHRYSHDADYEYEDLREHFAELLEALDADPRWKLKRRQFGRVITGRFDGVETGLRQLRRARPLQTETVQMEAGPVVIPTLGEMIRVKGWMILDRGDTRDYVDFAALTGAAGVDGTRSALEAFDDCYRDMERDGSERDTDSLMQLQWQLDDPRPADLDDQPPSTYLGIQSPWDDWERIQAQCAAAARTIDPIVCGDGAGSG